MNAIPHLELIIGLQLVIGLAAGALGVFVMYLFYARLRDIARELQKIRVVFETDRQRNAGTSTRSVAVTGGDNRQGDEARFMPKK